jgi:hypothetical protein
MVLVILTAGALPLAGALVDAAFFATAFVGVVVFFAAAFLVANVFSLSLMDVLLLQGSPLTFSH